jgi:hypothetical protein
MDWSLAMTGAGFVGLGLLSYRLDRALSWVIGLNHTPGCTHLDSNGRIPVGTTSSARLIYRGFAIAGMLEIFFGLALIVGSFFRIHQ